MRRTSKSPFLRYRASNRAKFLEDRSGSSCSLLRTLFTKARGRGSTASLTRNELLSRLPIADQQTGEEDEMFG
jgi:hypothetical protein